MKKHIPTSGILQTRPDTRPIPVADGWAGAEMRVFTLSNSIITDGPTDQRTNGRTDQRTDKASYRVACPQLKSKLQQGQSMINEVKKAIYSLLGEKRRMNSRKSVRWSAVPVAPMLVRECMIVRGAAAPKGPVTYA